MKKTIKIFLACLVFLVPVAVAAQVTDVASLYNFLAGTIDKLYFVLLSIALVVFIWGLGKFILSAGDEKTHASGKQLMIWGVVSFLVLTLLWAIVGMLVGSFGLDTNTPCFVDKNGQQVGGADCG